MRKGDNLILRALRIDAIVLSIKKELISQV